MRIGKHNVVIVSTLAAIGTAFVLGVWIPESRKLDGYRQRIEAAQEKLSPTFNRTGNIAERQTLVNDLTRQIDTSDRYVPADQELAQLLRSLTQSVKDQGIEEHQVETGDIEPFKHYSMIPLRMELDGPFTSTYGVVERIESMQRLVRLDALNLRMQDDPRGAKGGGVRASLRLSTFYSDEAGGGL